MIMMLLGYYNSVINAMNDLRGGDWSSLAILLPYVIGLLVGIVFIAKLMNFLLKKYGALTFCAIFGLVIGSPVALLMQNRECFPLATAGNWIVSIVCLVDRICDRLVHVHAGQKSNGKQAGMHSGYRGFPGKTIARIQADPALNFFFRNRKIVIDKRLKIVYIIRVACGNNRGKDAPGCSAVW